MHTLARRERGCKKLLTIAIHRWPLSGTLRRMGINVPNDNIIIRLNSSTNYFFWKTDDLFASSKDLDRPNGTTVSAISSSTTWARNIRRFDIAIHEYYLFYNFEIKLKNRSHYPVFSTQWHPFLDVYAVRHSRTTCPPCPPCPPKAHPHFL